MPVAETFTFEDENGQSLSAIAQLDTMVTVVDAGSFMNDFSSWDDLAERKIGLSDDDTRNIVDLLVDQIEFANVIVINKTDLISKAQLVQLSELLRKLNPQSQILFCENGQVPIRSLLGTGLYSLSEAESRPDWLKTPRGEEQSETDEYGISSFAYQSRRPFHPKRLSDAMDQDMAEGLFSGVLRSKGLIWIASKHDWAYEWSQAGCSIRIDPKGWWWAAAPEDAWPQDEEGLAIVRRNFVGQYGDRRQELVFIGNAMDELNTRQILDQCLLTDEEYERGPSGWSELSDPFPAIELEEEESEPDKAKLNESVEETII